MRRVSVIVATYNRSALLRRCLESLSQQVLPHDAFDVLVIDDGSTDGTDRVVEDLKVNWPSLEIFYEKVTHHGPASARNLAIRKCDSEFVAFIDDDAYADRAWLSKLIKCFEETCVDAVEGCVLNPNDEVLPLCHYAENRDGGQYLTANMAFRRSVLVELGMFDTDFKFANAEDKELACRLFRAERKLTFCPDAVVYHPARRVTLQQAARKWAMFEDFILLYSVHPDLFAKVTRRSMPYFLLDNIVLGPMVEIRDWIRRAGSLTSRVELLFFSFSKAVVKACEVVVNLRYLQEGNRKLREAVAGEA